MNALRSLPRANVAFCVIDADGGRDRMLTWGALTAVPRLQPLTDDVA